jgi:hypothetical protein
VGYLRILPITGLDSSWLSDVLKTFQVDGAEAAFSLVENDLENDLKSIENIDNDLEKSSDVGTLLGASASEAGTEYKVKDVLEAEAVPEENKQQDESISDDVVIRVKISIGCNSFNNSIKDPQQHIP